MPGESRGPPCLRHGLSGITRAAGPMLEIDRAAEVHSDVRGAAGDEAIDRLDLLEEDETASDMLRKDELSATPLAGAHAPAHRAIPSSSATRRMAPVK